MLEVACAVCGAVYRFSQIDIPVGGKTVTCAKCKARIVVQAPPTPPPMAGGTGDIIDLNAGPGPGDPIDLPMPVADIVDLPAPKIPGPEPAREIVDLPAPRLIPRDQAEALTLDNIDLLAPVGPTRSKPPAPAPLLPTEPGAAAAAPPAPGTAPAPRKLDPSALPDLPAPKRAADPQRPSFAPPPPPPFASPQSMPAPPRPPAQARPVPPVIPPIPGPPADLPDLPAPKFGGVARADLFEDLPSRGPSLTDLPTPKRPSVPAPAPAPTQPPDGGTDLPAPKGFFDDLPRPAGPSRDAGADLPAPKGFFDDLPQPAGPGKPDLPAPKGFFDDLPQAASAQARPDLPAPKGFFDDLPQAASPSRPDLPAPKGFFDDLPQVSNQARTDLPAPKGFFDDLPQPGHAASGVDLPAPRDFFDDVPQRSRGPSLDLDAARLPPTSAPADLAPPLDLGGSGPEGDNLSGLDLPDAPPMVPATRTGVVAFRASGETDGGAVRVPPPTSDLDVVGGTQRRDQSQTIATRPDAGPRLEPRKLKRLIAIVAAAVVLLGAGGFMLYRRWEAKKQRAAAIERNLNVAHRALVAGDAGHWGNAISAAKEVLTRSPKHGEALATAALAQLAGYYDQGTNKDGRVKAGRSLLEQARLVSASGPTMFKATAIDALIEGDAKGAIDRLAPMVPSDPEAVLYLAWAQLAAQRWDEAAATYEQAITATPGRKVAATYGRGQALLGKGDLEGARTAFLAVIELDKDHVGAQVGLAAASPPAEFLQRENELLAILQRPKLDAVDPRVRALAWRLAGNDARTAGRLDAARERYRKALELVEDDVATMVASAALELRDGKLDVASTGIERALATAPDDVDANLVKIELDLAKGELDAAATRIKTLRDRKPPIAAVAPRGQLELLDGQRLTAARDFTGALKAYRSAKDVLGSGDITPTIALATLLGDMADDADRTGKPDDAAKLRAQASTELGELAGAAASDPAKAVALGVAYLEAGGLADAERWLRTATAARPDDVEAHFQLSQVLRKAGRVPEAIDELKQAFTLAPARVDLGLALARAYEDADRDADARAAYDTLLADEDKDADAAAKISLDVRARAGRFYARTGDKKHAGKEGEAILAVEADHTTGRFLKGEGLLAAGRAEDARRELQRAADKEADGQFLDGLGRGWEAIFVEKGDTAARDEAVRAYTMAVDKNPHRSIKIHALDGAGRLFFHRRDYEKAIEYLLAAYTLEPNAERAGYIGQSYAALKQTRDATRYLEIAATGRPSPEALLNLGEIYVFSNRAADAARAYTRATELAAATEGANKVPWLTDAYATLGDLEKGRDNFGAACRAYRQYLSRNPPNADKIKAISQEMLGIPGCRP